MGGLSRVGALSRDSLFMAAWDLPGMVIDCHGISTEECGNYPGIVPWQYHNHIHIYIVVPPGRIYLGWYYFGCHGITQECGNYPGIVPHKLVIGREI